MVKVHSEDDLEILKEQVTEWEKRTGLVMEYDFYTKVYQKDVNNYIVINDKGEYKCKGAYVKKLHDLDYDLPIVNKALKNYFINNIPPERTIYDCNDLREFQKIVKVSGKYKYAVHGDQILSERVLRVFASRSRNDLGLFKVHKSKTSLDKVANTPERCFIENDDIFNVHVPSKLDKSWYVDLAWKRIKDFIGD